MQSMSFWAGAVSIAFASLFVTAPVLSQPADLHECTEGLIGNYAETDATAAFELFGIEASAEDYGRKLDSYPSLRIGAPFYVTLDFGIDDPFCESGWMELVDTSASAQGTPMRFIVRRVELAENDIEYRSEALTLEYDPNPLGNEFLFSRVERSGNVGKLGEATFRAGLHIGGLSEDDKRVAVDAPLSPGESELSVVVYDHNDEPFRFSPGKLTISGPAGFQEVRDRSSSFSGIVSAGDYSAVFEAMGTRIQRDFVVEAGVPRRIKIKGSDLFGMVGWKSGQPSLVREMMGFKGTSDRSAGPRCSYSKAGEEILESSCIFDEMPKGDYRLSVTPTLIPAISNVRVTAGESTDYDAGVGILALHDSDSPASGKRQLSVIMQSSDGATAEFDFQGKTKQMLPVGEYKIEVRGSEDEETFRRTFEVKSAKMTVVGVEIGPPGSVCPEDVARWKESRDWPGACGTGRRPYEYEAGLTGLWDIEAPGNPHLDELFIAISRGFWGVGMRGADAPYVAAPIEKPKGTKSYRESGVNLDVADDGTITFKFGQYEFCSCVSIKFVAKPTGDPNVMTGTWEFLRKKGIAIWRRRPPATIKYSYFRNHTADPEQAFVRDNVTFGGRPLKIERRHEITCGSGRSRGNCDGIWITIIGENFAGGHDVWIDPASHMEITDAGWLCASGSHFDYGREWYRCGSKNTEADGVVGLRLMLVFWNGITPGQRTLWVDGHAVPLELAIEGHPANDDWTPKPELVALDSYDINNNKISELLEGSTFILQATFEGKHPDQWVSLDIRPDRAAQISDEEVLEPGSEETSARRITLMRTEDRKVFRSERMILQSEAK